MRHWLIGWHKCLDFSGRASRREYWMCGVVSLVIAVLLATPILFVYIRMCLQNGVEPLSAALGGSLIWILVAACPLFPCFAAEMRRLHDVGKSGRCELWWLVPVVGWIKMVRLLAREGDPHANVYGPPPLE